MGGGDTQNRSNGYDRRRWDDTSHSSRSQQNDRSRRNSPGNSRSRIESTDRNRNVNRRSSPVKRSRSDANASAPSEGVVKQENFPVSSKESRSQNDRNDNDNQRDFSRGSRVSPRRTLNHSFRGVKDSRSPRGREYSGNHQYDRRRMDSGQNRAKSPIRHRRDDNKTRPFHSPRKPYVSENINRRRSTFPDSNRSKRSPPSQQQQQYGTRRGSYAAGGPHKHSSNTGDKERSRSSATDRNNSTTDSKRSTVTKIEEHSSGELSSSNDDDLDDLNVDKWVRSAPEELYYKRNDTGEFVATDAAKKLCRKFERKLLLKAQTARLEAEQLGEIKLAELAQQEKLEIEQQKELKRLKREGKCCPAEAGVEGQKVAEGEDAISTVGNSTTVVEKTTEECDKHEEGEICDCEEIQPSKQSEKNCDADKTGNINAERNSAKAKDFVSVKTKKIDQGKDKGQKSSCDSGTKENKKCDPLQKQQGKKRKWQDSSCDSKTDKKSADTTKNDGKKNNKNKKKRNCSHSDESCRNSTNCQKNSSSDSSSSDSDDDDSDSDDVCGISRSDAANRELEKRTLHPRRLHTELWHNDPGLMNDGPLCRCSAKARRFGIRHGFYPGEDVIPRCDPFSTNKSKLVHYRITISPPKNFLVKTPTVINHDGHEYIFEGFSLFSHHKVDLKLPPCKVIRFNIRYDIFVAEEKFPESFCVQELELFETYLFREVLELLDLKYDWKEENGCSPFHLMPRFVRQLPDNGKEILSMNRVLLHLLKSDQEIIQEEQLSNFFTIKQTEWQNFADKHKGMIVTKFGQKPCAIRVDQIDRDIDGQEIDPEDGIPYPLLVHFGIRPPQLSYAGNANYQRAWRRYVKYRHLLSNMAKPSAEEKRKLASKELKLQEMRTASSMKRDVTVAVSAKGFRTTGIFCDLVQHAMLIPVLVAHLRFHKSLTTLEKEMKYEFKNRFLLQLAMTHPSYRENFGTNPDHARNALTNCGIRQPEYGDRRIHYASTRKRGINTLINIMAKFGSEREMESEITHNERLEFLGDAVVEFVTSIHLFHMFPNLEEGGLATYRAAIVQNQHLAVLAQRLGLDQYMLYAHGSDLCHDSELRHAMANCFEALMGALFLDGGIDISDTVFGTTLFLLETELHKQWEDYPRHPLQIEEPYGDRHWIKTHTVLQKLAEFESRVGVQFTHIRLLARAFTDRSLGYNNLSKGSNQRLEFLGDTVLQLIASEYLYRHFPDHHEGHLSLLRSSLVNNRTQAVVCDDLGMAEFAMRGDPKSEMKTKDRADLLEAVLGSLYIDKGLEHCTTFCSVCFFPRLNKSIIEQEWNDPKSKLQQCCLTLRAMDGREPDIPVYKVTQSLGPTNTRIYIVAVYFRGERLATAQGHSIQEAEMNAAALALEQSGHLFPQLHHQRSVLDKTKKRQKRYR